MEPDPSLKVIMPTALIQLPILSNILWGTLQGWSSSSMHTQPQLKLKVT